MRGTALMLGAIALVACSKQPDDAAADKASTNRAANTQVGSSATPGSGPSFDCARADGQAQELVCSDAQLAAIDRELDRIYRLADGDPALDPMARQQLVPMQRGWVKGRDDCWKADDLRQCVTDAYGERIATLRTISAAAGKNEDGISAGPVGYRCDGLEGGFTATFINSEPGVIHLAWRGLNTTLTHVESASGAKYQGRVQGEEWAFWNKGGEAVLTHPGQGDLNCREAADV